MSEKKEVEKYNYAILQETSDEEAETWLYFLRYEGNEAELKFLGEQLEQVKWKLLEDLSTFDLDMENLVSEQTAKEMTKVDTNYYTFHRKFDGTLKHVDLGFKSHYNNKRKIKKANEVLGIGKIEEFIDKEDYDPESVAVGDDEEDDEEDEEEESEEEEEEEEKPKKKKGTLPKKVEVPRFAKAKKHHK